MQTATNPQNNGRVEAPTSSTAGLLSTSTTSLPPVDFLTIATAAVQRGFAVIPLQPGSKEPISGVGALSRSRDPQTIALWANAEPYANVGIVSDEQITILESDNEEQFRALICAVSLKLFGEERDIPSTLTSQARPNRPHFFFKRTAATRAVDGSPRVPGLFEWRNNNQYVVGPGSLHPSGALYLITNDTAIADFPEWLVEVLAEIRRGTRGEGGAAAEHVQVEVAAKAKAALISKYALDVDAMLADGFVLDVPEGERHYFLQSLAGLLHDGDRDEEQLAADLLKLRDAYCPGKSDYEVERIAEWTYRREAAAVEPLLPPDERVTVGSGEKGVGRKGVKGGKRFTYRFPAIEGKNYQYTLEPISGPPKASGWLMRGQTHGIAGSSGAGKSTLMLDLLRTQRQSQYFLGHRGGGLDYFVIAGDRGRLGNEQTLDRLDMRDEAWRFGFVNGESYDDDAVQEIIELIEDRSPLPQIVFIEGADLMTADPIAMPSVARFVGGLNEVAEHYHIAIVLSVGAGKVKAKDGMYKVQREQIYGSGAWGRKLDMVACLNYVADECDNRRDLTISHRHGRAEHFDLVFTDTGRLVQEAVKPEEVALSDIDLWIAAQGATTFTRKDAIAAMAAIDGSSAATVKRRIRELVEEGRLAEGELSERGRILRLAQAQISAQAHAGSSS